MDYSKVSLKIRRCDTLGLRRHVSGGGAGVGVGVGMSMDEGNVTIGTAGEGGTAFDRDHE